MRIVLFSDIHANLPALEAFFSHADKQGYDAIYCLGDLVGYNVWPNEVIDMIRSRRIPVIAGNYDVGIGSSTDDCGCAYKTPEDKGNGAISIAYTNEVIQPDQRTFLHNLPAHLRLEFRFGSDVFNVLMVHGSPRRVNEYLFEDREEKSLQRIMQDAGAHVMCFGHTHIPYHRQISGNTGFPMGTLHAVNIGSVGKPKDGNSRGGYVILNIGHHDAAPKISVEFLRFSYDIERAARAVEQSRLPNAYAESLRSGK